MKATGLPSGPCWTSTPTPPAFTSGFIRLARWTGLSRKASAARRAVLACPGFWSTSGELISAFASLSVTPTAEPAPPSCSLAMSAMRSWATPARAGSQASGPSPAATRSALIWSKIRRACSAGAAGQACSSSDSVVGSGPPPQATGMPANLRTCPASVARSST